jgi:hypothetical protein
LRKKRNNILPNFCKNFAEKWDISTKCLGFFAKPKTGRFAKSEIFVYLREFSEKLETVLLGYYGAEGETV